MNKQFLRLPGRLILAAIILVATASCATQQPDLHRLYSGGTVAEDQPPVVIVPGTMGVRLAYRDTGYEIWPGGMRKFIIQDYDELMVPIDSATLEPIDVGVVPTDIFDSEAGLNYYKAILDALEEGGGYIRTEIGTPATHGEKRYYVFLYDWRYDLVRSAAALDEFLNEIREDWGDPGLRFDIIAHSMGGSITRYYARYGTEDVVDDNDFPVNGHGAERIRKAILVGTPNLGSVKAIQALVEGLEIRFVQPPAEVSVTYSSAYMMLPHPINNWLLDINGNPIETDLFDVDFWRDNRLSVYDPEIVENIKKRFDTDQEGEEYLRLIRRFFARNLERARRFVWSLTVPVPESMISYIVFGGVCLPTPARVVLEEEDGRTRLRFYPKDIDNPVAGVDYEQLMLEPGDSVVTKASLLARQSLDPGVERHKYSFFPVHYPVFLCGSHHRITHNVMFQDNLLHALLSVDPF